jgi:hypothetical protein
MFISRGKWEKLERNSCNYASSSSVRLVAVSTSGQKIIWQRCVCCRARDRSYMHAALVFSNTLSLCCSLNVRDHVSHPYRTTGKIIVLYFLIFTFCDSGREDRCFCTEW